MIPYLYGNFKKEQMEEYKKKLHDKLFWCLLYAEPQIREQFGNVDVDKYFYFLLLEIDGLNRILEYPKELVEIQSIVHEAKTLIQNENFEYMSYRKLVLDSHSR